MLMFTKDDFFHLQSEFGDLYKATLDFSNDVVHALKIKYFDTAPVSTNLCILKTGFLFVASEFGNQLDPFFLIHLIFFSSLNNHLYRFPTLGEDGDEIEYSFANYPSLGMGILPREYFELRPIRNPMLTDDIAALNPVIQRKSSILGHTPGHRRF